MINSKNAIYINWNNSNNLGISIIDEQHRGIISLINSLYTYTQNGREFETLKNTMMAITRYSQKHFKTEEALMAQAKYPGIEQHIALHKKLLGQFKKVTIEANLEQDTSIALKFLREWWLTHINKEDRKYLPFMKK